ncbi:MAG: MOSC N-terminal beta barrel domain-containing protein [Woeseiaceae bacterium]
MSNIEVSELFIYPVKSCRGISLNSSEIEPFGLKHDRRWMVVDESGMMITQRKKSEMCLIQPKLVNDGLVLSSASIEDLHVVIPSNNKIKVKVWHDECQALDAGDEAAQWFSTILSVTCRLVYFSDEEFRQVDLSYAKKGDKTAFSDGFPLLLLSQASLDDLNMRLNHPISIERFRPNIVVKGCEAFAEDAWNKIKINGVELRVVKPCSRCVIPSINIETATREEEPLKTLATFRKRERKIFFGQNVIGSDSNETQTIHVDSEVKLLS